MGFDDLVLVEPQCSPQDDEARMFASGSRELLDQARIAESLVAGLDGCQRAIAFTSRSRSDSDHLLSLPDLAETLEHETPVSRTALVFGPEDFGLSNEDLGFVSHRCQIPTSPAHRSLNLSQAVLLAAWEVGLRRGRALGTAEPAPSGDRPDLAELRQLRESLQGMLDRVGFLNPQNPDHIMRSFWTILSRADLDAREVAMLRGMVRQVLWKVSGSEVPAIVAGDDS